MEFKCSICNYTSDTKRSVVRHINKKIKCGDNPTVMEVPVEISCEYCNKKITTIPNLNKHLKVCKVKKEDFLKNEKNLRKKIVELTMNLDGSFSAEHGIGVTRKAELKKYKKDELNIMKSIKKSIDDKNILNPGKIIDY